ncbi:MAG: TetR/AcrR family transcriptional regulator [Treponema sp.]
MAVVVEHEKRRSEILSKALDLFVEEGYEDVTFQKIADRCGITRTTLYIYFKNKREIFLWSIKQLTGGLEKKLVAIIADTSLSSPNCLKKILNTVIDGCEENHKLFNVLLPYILQLQRSGIDPSERVTRRIIKLQHLMSTVIIRGIKKGEFKKISVKVMNDLFYDLIESAIFKLAVLNQAKAVEIRETIDVAIDEICTKK